MRARQRKVLLAVGGLVLAAALLVGVLLARDYPASETAAAAMTSDAEVTVVQEMNGSIAFIPQHAARGLIFFPGAMVEAPAYAPLMRRFAQDGTLCVLLNPPLELAFFAMAQAEAALAGYPQVQQWFVGGHSLGGYVGSRFAATHADRVSGMLLLAAYASVDLTKTGLRVASVYGTSDGVLNQGRYQKGLALLPDDFEEIVIEGGCHAYFGDYGMQRGDGTSAVTREEQMAIAAQALMRLAGTD